MTGWILAPDPLVEAERGLAGPVPLWWLWLLVAIGFIALIIWLIRRINPGGPWF